ncbi:Hypothetical_protein [Hexamita inflata]|uniref:Hypothetical_protein n=1 Tax=Hexamita inflata TaxID=28002 RepID=A0AA86UAP2_9EUKA|nr:Hypothetical protein HINF_LOCUS37845 [Hexamita inflata]
MSDNSQHASNIEQKINVFREIQELQGYLADVKGLQTRKEFIQTGRALETQQHKNMNTNVVQQEQLDYMFPKQVQKYFNNAKSSIQSGKTFNKEALLKLKEIMKYEAEKYTNDESSERVQMDEVFLDTTQKQGEIIEQELMLDCPDLQKQAVCGQKFKFGFHTQFKLASKNQIKLYRSQPGSFYRVQSEQFNAYHILDSYWIEYETSFADISYELILQIELKNGNLRTYDVYKISDPVICNQAYSEQIKRYSTKLGFEFQNVMVDDLNYGERCKLIVTKAAVQFIGQTGFENTIPLNEIRLNQQTGMVQLTTNLRKYVIQMAENEADVIQTAYALINVLKTGEEGAKITQSTPRYIVSFDQSNEGLQPFRDPNLGGATNLLKIYLNGMDFTQEIYQGSVETFVKFEQHLAGYVIEMECAGEKAQVFKVGLDSGKERIELFQKGKVIVLNDVEISFIKQEVVIKDMGDIVVKAFYEDIRVSMQRMNGLQVQHKDNTVEIEFESKEDRNEAFMLISSVTKQSFLGALVQKIE